jgi:hypothetical protein
MHISRTFWRGFAACGLFAACAAGPVMTGPAVASTPLLIWQQAKKLQLLCVLVSDSRDRIERQAELCERVRAIAAANAPVPIEIIAPGDPAVLAADAVTLLVHASSQPGPGGGILALTARPYRLSAGDAGPLFGAAPRAASLSQPAAIETALRGALSDTLPWLPQQNGPRPLR